MKGSQLPTSLMHVVSAMFNIVIFIYIQNGLNALHLAAKEGYVELVQELINRGAKVESATKVFNTPPVFQHFHQLHSYLLYLLSTRNMKCCWFQKGNTALHVASLGGKLRVAKLLVEHGSPINAQSQLGFTPLYMAAQENKEDIVKFLLDHGADPSLTTEVNIFNHLQVIHF